MDERKTTGTGGGKYTGSPSVNWELLTSWPFIVAAFVMGFWPIGLFLIFKSAALEDQKRAKRRAEQMKQTTGSARSTVTKQPVKTAKTAKTKKSKSIGTHAGLGFIIFGAILAFGGLMGVFETVDMIQWAGTVAGYLGELWSNLTVAAAGGGLLGLGLLRRNRQRRFPRYLAFINSRRAVSFREIASAMGLSERKVIRDLENMLDQGLLPKDAYLDMGREFYFAGADAVPAEEKPKQAQPKTEDEYTAILRNIRELNDRIADEELSAQIDRIEDISRKIFREVERCPAKKSQIGTLLNYYLPTTQKLLDSYATFEAAGVEGTNMNQAKNRIETTMKRIVQGFEKQLDQLYSADLMDVESDIRVMENMLNRDGAGSEKEFELRL